MRGGKKRRTMRPSRTTMPPTTTATFKKLAPICPAKSLKPLFCGGVATALTR